MKENPLLLCKKGGGFSWNLLHQMTGISEQQLRRILDEDHDPEDFLKMKVGTMLALEDALDFDIKAYIVSNLDNNIEF